MNISQVDEYFRKAAVADRVSHAYLFESENASSLLQAAENFSKLLTCDERTACGKCYSCQAISSGNHPDVRTLVPDKAGLISVDNIRDLIVSDAYIRPYHSRYKIYIVPEADSMNVQAQNALLKTLEEMPSYGIVILLSSNTGRFLPTILSRCFHIRISGYADMGNMSDNDELFLSLLRDADSFTTADMIDKVRLLQGDKKSDASERLSGDRAYELASVWLRDMLTVKSAVNERFLAMPGEIKNYSKLVGKYSYRDLEEAIKQAAVLRDRLRANVNYELAMQLFLTSIRIQ